MVTDYAGRPSDWENLKKLSIKYNFKLINDNCHALEQNIKNLIATLLILQIM